MKRSRTWIVAITAAALGAAAPVLGQDAGRRETSEQDQAAILQVTKDFQTAIAKGDAHQLSTLLLDDRILFSSPSAPETIRKLRDERDAHFVGIDAAGATRFLQFVATSKEPIEERFHDIRITQDGHLAWVVFDYEFLVDGKVQNYGIETWQLLKTADERWKIFSVVWSVHVTR